MPVVAAGLLLVAVHALLHYGPLAIIGDKEAVQIEIEAVLDRSTIHLRDQPTCPRQFGPVETRGVGWKLSEKLEEVMTIRTIGELRTKSLSEQSCRVFPRFLDQTSPSARLEILFVVLRLYGWS